MLCQFLLYSKVTQSYVYIYIQRTTIWSYDPTPGHVSGQNYNSKRHTFHRKENHGLGE